MLPHDPAKSNEHATTRLERNSLIGGTAHGRGATGAPASRPTAATFVPKAGRSPYFHPMRASRRSATPVQSTVIAMSTAAVQVGFTKLNSDTPAAPSAV